MDERKSSVQVNVIRVYLMKRISNLALNTHQMSQIHFIRKLFVTMADTLKLFQFIRKSYGLLDIDLEQSQSPNCQLNVKTLLNLLGMFSLLTSTWAFIQFEAETIEEFANCFTGFFMIFFVMTFFVINLIKMPKIFQLIEMMETFIEKSKYGQQKFFSQALIGNQFLYNGNREL